MATSYASKDKAVNLFLNLSFLILLLFYSASRFDSYTKSIIRTNSILSSDDSNEGCNGLHGFESYEGKCAYLVSETQCNPEGYINYLQLLYCTCGRYPVFGYALLFLWLILLFYLLGNTTAKYFCSNLEGLSTLLKLSPAIAGVTLLSLGNGAPDVFSSIVSFVGSNSTNVVGLNSVLGGAFFVSTVVIGTISICIGPRKISINKSSFVRDLCFFLFVLLVLLAIIAFGKINLWGAMAFTSLYMAYVFLVGITHRFDSFLSRATVEDGELGDPLLITIENCEGKQSKNFYKCGRFFYFLELPLYLPRRLTIPDVSEVRWSKPFAVTSVTLAPVLLATLWDSKREELGSKESLVVYTFGGLVGTVLGIAAIVKTEKERPPKRLLLLWLAGGFLMSVVWTYIIAEELVSLLVSLGVILRISPSVLGLTVLAWGNSLGDLIANVAMAVNGGPAGVQVAVSGCYGGPIFNTLVGLGLSFVFSSWAGYPNSMPIPRDPTLFQTLGFLVGGLLWALGMLTRREMKLDRVLGFGLVCIYLCFLFVRLSQSFGLLELQGTWKENPPLFLQK